MFLQDLFRYRTTKTKEHREDFLSSALAELIRRDAGACREVLVALGLTPPADLETRRIRTQVRRRDGDLLGIPDVVIETPTWTGIVECKAGLKPDLSQVAKYQALWPDAAVAFLAPRKALRSRDPGALEKIPGTRRRVRWANIPSASWGEIVDALRGLDVGAEARFRDAFIDLAAHLGYRGKPSPSLETARKAIKAARRIEKRRAAMRGAVRVLLPLSRTPEPSEPHTDNWLEWGAGGAFDAYWESRKPIAKGYPLEGLGLEARARSGIGSDELEWVLSLWPATKALKKKLRDGDGDWINNDGWWSLPLSDVAAPSDSLGTHLERAVREARWWLRHDLGLVTSTARLPVRPRVQADSLVANVRRVDQFQDAIPGWLAHIWDEILLAINPPQEDDPEWGARVVRNTLRVWMGQSERMWFGYSWSLDGSPHLEIIANWGVRRNRKLRARLESWEPQEGLHKSFDDEHKGRVVLRAHLGRMALAEAAQALADSFAALFRSQAGAVLPPFSEIDGG